MSDRTAVQQDYVDAFARHLLADNEHRLAVAAEKDAATALRDAGDADNVELINALVDEAVALSRLGEDNPVIQNVRRAVEDSLREQEAIANGVDPKVAQLITMMGGDPRKPDGGLGGGGDLEF